MAVFGALLAPVLPVPADAAEIDHARQYQACMVLTKREPQAAFDSALAWRDMGGGDAARHCLAAALMEMEQYDEAADRFRALAEDISAGPLMKARLLGHAAQAWLMAGKPASAFGVLTAALKLSPDDPDLLVDRAAASADLGDYAKAVADLDRAIGVDPIRPDAWVFRASSHRMQDDLAAAEADAERALELDSRHGEGLLERGIIRRLNDDLEGARQDWLAVISHWPGTAAAEAARANLEKMDVRTKNE